MIRWAVLGAAIAMASACSSAPVRIDSRALGNQVLLSADHYIIVAVDNERATYVAHAGSTPRGYDAIADYGATARARETLHAVARQYGLREVNSWPIMPLQIDCAVLELPAGADRDQLLADLSKDRRVKLTQPLHTFATRTEDYNDPYVGLQRGFSRWMSRTRIPGLGARASRLRSSTREPIYSILICVPASPPPSTSWTRMTRSSSATGMVRKWRA